MYKTYSTWVNLHHSLYVQVSRPVVVNMRSGDLQGRHTDHNHTWLFGSRVHTLNVMRTSALDIRTHSQPCRGLDREEDTRTSWHGLYQHLNFPDRRRLFCFFLFFSSKRTYEVHICVSIVLVGFAQRLAVTAGDDRVKELQGVLLVGDRRRGGFGSWYLRLQRERRENICLW